jgi:hypothetical protein
MNKQEMECTCCKKKYLRWPYEIKYKRKHDYICRSCRKKNGAKITKNCVVCNNPFTVTRIVAKKQLTCSYACSNKHFRTGENNGNWNQDYYRTTCFLYHKKECVICGEKNVVEVHHFDENRENNVPDNLVPLCPTHHQYWHSKYKDIILDKVNKYVNNFKSRCSSIG